MIHKNMIGTVVRSAEPGFLIGIDADDSWRFVILINGIEVHDDTIYWTAADARWAMNEEVKRIREQAGLVFA